MAFCVLFTPRPEEGKLLQQVLYRRTARWTDQMLECRLCQNIEEAISCLREQFVHAVVWDVSQEKYLTELMRVRCTCRSAFLLLLAAPGVSPLAVLRPEITPTSLILHPLSAAEADRAACEILRWVCAEDGGFVVTRRGERCQIPWEEIYYFESREKKLYARLRGKEIGFLGTIEALAKTLPENFQRCHRGFIVNVEKISGVYFAKNTILLWDGMEIPLSRSYKNNIREYTSG